MAATAITKTVLSFNTLAEIPATAAVDATDGALVTYDKADHKTLIIVENSSTTTAYDVTFKKGNGLQGVADYTLEIPAGKKYCCVPESMKFVNISGSNKGKVVITGENAAIKIAAVVLP